MEIRKLTEKFELAHQYPGQSEPQDCYIELDLKNEILTADWNGEIGNAVPVDVYLGHTRRYSIPCLLMNPANDLLDEIAPLAERMIAGYESEWNGNNHVATLTDDAKQAEAAIEKICETVFEQADDSKTAVIWDAEEWLYYDKYETAGKTDAELEKMAEEYESQAYNDNIYLTDSVIDILKKFRDEQTETDD